MTHAMIYEKVDLSMQHMGFQHKVKIDFSNLGEDPGFTIKRMRWKLIKPKNWVSPKKQWGLH